MSHIVGTERGKSLNAMSPIRLMNPVRISSTSSSVSRSPSARSHYDVQGVRNRHEPHALALAHVFAVYLEGGGPGRSERHLGQVMQAQNVASARWAVPAGQHLTYRTEHADAPQAAQREHVQTGVEPCLRVRVDRPAAEIGPRRGVGDDADVERADRRVPV